MYNFLSKHLTYNEVTGEIRLKHNNQLLDKQNAQGYIQFSLYGIRLQASQVAMCFINKEWPLNVVDHINTDRADNRRANLRVVSRGMNNANRVNPNKSGERNITFLANKPATSKRYFLSIYKDGRYQHRKAYMTMEEAIKARKEWEIKLYGAVLV